MPKPTIILEYGIRGGYHRDNLRLPSVKLAMKIATDLVAMFSDNQVKWDFRPRDVSPRGLVSWCSSTHFVSLTVTAPGDTTFRGPASATLWKEHLHVND